MFCGNCLRDNAIVAALRRHGHDVTMLPLYLPLKTDEPDQSAGSPIFFGGINVYLEQRIPFARLLPRWLHRLLDSPRLLRWVGSAAAQTHPSKVGDLTVSMLRGEEGRQAREVDDLVQWLRDHPPHPDVISLSNALLIGPARRLKSALGSTIAVTLQGEDAFLDALPEPHRSNAWEILAQRLAETDLLIAPSRYYADLMAARLSLPPDRIHVVPNGINLAGWRVPEAPQNPPVLGFFARLCAEKGLDLLVDAYCRIRRRGRLPNLRLHLGGGLGPSDQPFVRAQQQRLDREGWAGQVELLPNLDHPSKQAFFQRLSVFSVPAHYGEAFGLYLVEAMAAGVPLVQPRTGAFPEIIEQSQAGLLAHPNDPEDLSLRIEEVLLQPDLAARLGRAGRTAAEKRYNNVAAAHRVGDLFAEALAARPAETLAR